MSQCIHGRDDDVCISDFLRVDFNSWHFPLPKSPLSVVNVDFEVDEDICHSGLPFYLIQHGR